MTQLAEVYRPRSWDAVIGQDAIRAKVDALRPRGLGGRAFWISGPSGTGKSTVALLIANELASDIAIEEIDAETLTARSVSDLERKSNCRAIGKGGWAFLVNEAHGLKNATIRQLLVTLERIPPHVAWLFTTTNAGQENLFGDCDDAGPLLSRCTWLPLAQRDLNKAFAMHVVRTSRAAGFLNGNPDEFYYKRAERYLKDNRNNLRMLWQAVDSGYLTANDDH